MTKVPKAPKKEVKQVGTKIVMVDYRRLLGILKRPNCKCLNVADFIRDAVLEKIAKEE